MSNSMEPHGLALLDYIHGSTSETINLERDDGYSEEMPINIYFRKPSDFYPHEHTALDLCFGKILDIGAGVSIFSLFAAAIAVLSLGFASGSPEPPMRAATVISLINFVKILPRLASAAPFLCLIDDHLLCPDMYTSRRDRFAILFIVVLAL